MFGLWTLGFAGMLILVIGSEIACTIITEKSAQAGQETPEHFTSVNGRIY